MQGEECIKRVLCKRKHCTDSGPISSTTELFYCVFVMSVIYETLDNGTVRIKLHYGNAPGIFPCFTQRWKRISFQKSYVTIFYVF